MSQLRPVYVVGPASVTRDEATRTLAPELDVRTVDDVARLLEELPPPTEELPGSTGAQGVVVALPELSPGDVLALLRGLAERPDAWLPLVMESGDEGLTARPVSLGFAEELGPVTKRGADPDAELPVLELRRVLKIVARARHDINNPLTAGLAEAQLLLMDVEDAELRESVELSQAQLNRFKDLGANLQALKRARPG